MEKSGRLNSKSSRQKTIVVDTETDGLLPKLTCIHCVCTRVIETGEERQFRPHEIDDAVTYLKTATTLVGHNLIGFDLRVFDKVTDWYGEGIEHYDTMIAAPVAWADVRSTDFALRVAAKNRGLPVMPAKLIGRQSLEAWGWRIGEHKGDFAKQTDWSEFSEEMLEYCVQDVRVTALLYNRIVASGLKWETVSLEQQFSQIMRDQQDNGFGFDIEAAEELTATLCKERVKLTTELDQLFPPRTITYLTPKKRLKRSKVIPFNPRSRDQIAANLMEKYSWKPNKFTDSGKPKLDEAVLSDLGYPEAKKLVRFFLLQKRLGMIAEGAGAWLKLQKKGRIHGRVIPTGTPHGRCSHVRPNLAQVPAPGVAYGDECRSLFIPEEGWKLVGCDAAGIQLRCLAHYLGRYDDGEYIRVVTESDPHTVNQHAAGLPTRKAAKTFIYAFLFGAGSTKLGGGDASKGKELISRFFSNTKGLGDLLWDLNSRVAVPRFCRKNKDYSEDDPSSFRWKKVKTDITKKMFIDSFDSDDHAVFWSIKPKAYLVGLDGRHIPLRSSHVALNYLLAGAEAALMKKATVNFASLASKSGLTHGLDYRHCAHVHDEVQIEAKPESAETVGRLFQESIQLAGKDYGFRCPLDGSFKVGNSWLETH